MAASHLAYIDKELDAYPHLEALVDSMVQEEMASFKPKDYLRELGLPEVPDFSGSPLLQAEMRRLAAGEEGMAPMDQTRYRVDPPSGAQAGSTEAWEDAVRNARSQLEHQRNRMTNLELLSKFGPNTWRLGASDLAGVKESLDKDLAGLEEKSEAINRRRKMSQEDAAPQLATLGQEWGELIAKNQLIAKAIETRSSKRQKG
eukprot:g5197.t1